MNDYVMNDYVMNDEDWFVFYEKNIYCCYHILSK